MDKLHPADELAGLWQFLERLESGYVRLRRNQVDVTKSESSILKREICRLERVLNVPKSGGHNAPVVRNDGRIRQLKGSSFMF